MFQVQENSPRPVPKSKLHELQETRRVKTEDSVEMKLLNEEIKNLYASDQLIPSSKLERLLALTRKNEEKIVHENKSVDPVKKETQKKTMPSQTTVIQGTENNMECSYTQMRY